MWKNLTRGLRETLERRVCPTNVYSQAQNEENNSNILSYKKSCLNIKNSCIDLVKHQNSFCGLFNNRGAKDKKHYSDWNKCAQRSISDVLGWSGILALGWVICQTPCIRKHIFEKHRRRNENKCYFSQFHKNNISHLLLNSLNLKPKDILPVINCIPNSNTNNKDELIKGDNEWLEDVPIGPITAQEALGASKENFTAIHKIVMSELELQIGVKALGEKQYKKAIEHFTTGAKLSSPGSMFNLGLCYQLGLGIPSDINKAAKFYKEAAKRGHADAMYNLGVFYAQGRGGLVKNKNIARDLFTKAANLGHHDAKTALELEKIKIKEKELALSNKTQSTVPSKTATNIFKRSINIFSSKINYNDDDDDDDLYDNSYKSYYPINNYGNNDYYLNFLGIQPKSVPILMEAVQ
ncbi:hypothetical protein HCN44_008370 [Aphidius gifuensis]|uniref:Uncharacterized protein n=1 Tax=Aphidius gifuensis TaxID=684658 RepID=A0A834XMW5_APHGI|nr:hypothetical protein HCN44_008370 [Aphidius gifuensis]